jgi:Domain of unknown function (DUF1996)
MPVRRLLATAFVALAAVVAATAVAGTSRKFPGPDLPQLDGVEFVVLCRFSHRAPDDPIVFPGRPEMSHDHTFFGSVETDAFSTPASLRETPTSCLHAEDTAAYWAPTLIVANKAVTPVIATVYYRRRTVAKVRAFPPGLQIVAGDANATAPQSLGVTFWNCGGQGGSAPTSTVPTCGNGPKTLHLHVRFPDCWDGRRLDSADHKQHMAYSARGACPSSHPVAVPSLTIVIQYPVSGGPDVELSSRGQLTGHADFVNAWNQRALERRVATCLNALRTCGSAL